MTDYIGTIDGLMQRVTDLEADLYAVARALNTADYGSLDYGNLASQVEAVVIHRRLLAQCVVNFANDGANTAGAETFVRLSKWVLSEDDAAFDRARRFVDAGGDRTQRLLELIGDDE